MCIFGRKSKKTENPVAPSSPEKEFRLMRGVFRDYLAGQNKTGCYGMCMRDWEMVCPPGVSPAQDQFYRLVCHFMRDLLRANHSVVIVEDVSGSESWSVQKAYFKQLAANHGGVVIEECGKTKSNCAFIFSTMPDSFLNEIFWWMAEHLYESIYAEYSILEKSDSPFSSISEIEARTKVNVLIDDVHPVLILRLASRDLEEDTIRILTSACNQEGFSFSGIT